MKKYELLRSVIDNYRPLYNSMYYFSKNLSFFQKRKLYKKVYKIFLKDFKNYKNFEVVESSKQVFENESDITIE